jgi:hypothetical protein
MENLLLLLPDRPASIVLRYALTTLIVGICFLLQLGVELQSGFFGLFLLLPGIFIASLVFDRGSGFYATILSVALSVLILMRPGGGFGLLSQHLVPLVLFVLIGLGVATVSEALRNALEKAVRAERAKDLALYELNHRIRNDLAMMPSVCWNWQPCAQNRSRGQGGISFGGWAHSRYRKCPRSSAASRRPIVDRHEGVSYRLLRGTRRRAPRRAADRG